MDLRKLKTLIDLVSESAISELEITEGDGRVRIVKSAPAAAAPQMTIPYPMHAPAQVESLATEVADAQASLHRADLALNNASIDRKVHL